MNLEEQAFIKFLSKFDEHAFVVKTENGDSKIGDGEPEFTVVFHKMPELHGLMKSTSIALGEAYMNGELEIEGDLYCALNSFLGQMGKFSTDHKALKNLMFTPLSKKNQHKEVSSHYDIGNDFYSLWLDETMSYSCAYFKTPDDTLYQAQKNKVERILEKLYLKKDMTLCDIGCGWGYLLIEAAKKYGIRGVGITLSSEQKKKFEERIGQENLGGQLEVRLMDYRELPKSGLKFDRVVSVGMIEHVGRDNYQIFMESAKSILQPGGLFLLHFISALKEFPGDAWIKKYIFPGGVVPSLREIISLAAECSFYTLDVESLRRHYNKTLLCWNDNFQKHREEVVQKFGEQFTRMWELYLCSCAATFRNGVIDVHQLLLSNGVNNGMPMTRWY